jgi:hypothetical protein
VLRRYVLLSGSTFQATQPSRCPVPRRAHHGQRGAFLILQYSSRCLSFRTKLSSMSTNSAKSTEPSQVALQPSELPKSAKALQTDLNQLTAKFPSLNSGERSTELRDMRGRISDLELRALQPAALLAAKRTGTRSVTEGRPAQASPRFLKRESDLRPTLCRHHLREYRDAAELCKSAMGVCDELQRSYAEEGQSRRALDTARHEADIDRRLAGLGEWPGNFEYGTMNTDRGRMHTDYLLESESSGDTEPDFCSVCCTVS